MEKRGLVKGYMVVNTNEELKHPMETLFAVYPNGKITSCTKRFSNTFNEKGVEWVEVSEVPTEAEFIGNYYM